MAKNSFLQSNSSINEVIVYAVVFLFLIILLFIVAKFLKNTLATKARNLPTPFGMTTVELDKLKTDGGLTDEEIKRVRKSMAKQLVERVREEENKKNIAGGAEIALATFENRIMQEGVEKVKREEFKDFNPSALPIAKPVEIAKAIATATPASTAAIAPHLEPLLAKSDMELEALLDAGFLTREELTAIRAARP